MVRKERTLKFSFEPTRLEQRFNTAGSDQSWKDRIRQFCQKQRINIEHFVKASVAFLNPDFSKSRLRREQNRVWTAFDQRRNPQVPVFLRKIFAFFSALDRRQEPLPIAA